MSINATANAALARRPDYPPFNRLPANATERAQAAAKDPTPENPTSTALKTVSTYIPSELLTLYVAFTAALTPLASDPTLRDYTTRWALFGLFFALTPTAVWVAFATKLIADKKRLPRQWSEWPKWEMTASLIAYVAWAAALPDTPFASLWGYSAAVAAIFVALASTALGWLAGLFPQLQKTDPVSDNPQPKVAA